MNNVIQFPNKKDVIAGWTYKDESVEMTIRWEIVHSNGAVSRFQHIEVYLC